MFTAVNRQKPEVSIQRAVSTWKAAVKSVFKPIVAALALMLSAV